MSVDGDPAESGVGYKRPPKSTRFQKGRSGNPRGRPKKSRKTIPYDHILGQMVTVREDGKERRITAAEAFLLQLSRRGLQGDGPSMRAFLGAIETARQNRPEPTEHEILRIILTSFGLGSAMSNLGMVVKRFAQDKQRTRADLKAWIVEASLVRFGTKRLTIEEQREVWCNCHQPEKIEWPEWWNYRGEG